MHSICAELQRNWSEKLRSWSLLFLVQTKRAIWIKYEQETTFPLALRKITKDQLKQAQGKKFNFQRKFAPKRCENSHRIYALKLQTLDFQSLKFCVCQLCLPALTMSHGRVRQRPFAHPVCLVVVYCSLTNNAFNKLTFSSMSQGVDGDTRKRKKKWKCKKHKTMKEWRKQKRFQFKRQRVSYVTRRGLL